MSLTTLLMLVVASAMTLLAVRSYRDSTPAGRWARALRSADARERLAAAALMHGPEPIQPATLVAGLIRALRDPNPAIRVQAARSLPVPIGEASRPGQAALDPTLVEEAWQGLLDHLLGDRDPQLRAVAATSLGAIAAATARGDEIAPKLIGALKDPDADVRLAAARTFRKLRPGTPTARRAWLAALDDAEVQVRLIALAALGEAFGPDEEVCRAILTRLEDPDPSIRAAAGGALEGLRTPPAGVAPDLVALLERRPDRLAPLPRRPDRLPSDDDQIIGRAGRALARIGPAAGSVVPALGTLLDEARTRGDSPQVVAVAEALGGIAPGSPEGRRAVEALVDLLRAGTRPRPGAVPGSEVARVLGTFGAAGAPALPALREAARTPNESYMFQAAREAVATIEAAREAVAGDAPTGR